MKTDKPRIPDASHVSEAVRRANPHIYGKENAKLPPPACEDGARIVGRAKSTGGSGKATGGLGGRIYETDTHGKISHPKPQRDKAPALERTNEGEASGLRRARVRFVGYRVRPLDPDNFAGSCKDLLDGLRHAALIPGDEPWRIIFETEQVKVRSFKQEKTEIELDL